MRVAREAGLTASPRRAGARPAGPPAARLGQKEIAQNRERRARLGSYLLGFSLLLGLAWLGLYIGAAFPESGVPSTFYGVALDDTTNAPIGNATVTIENTNLSATTDATGNFTIPRVASGPIRVNISKVGYHNTTFALYILPQSGPSPSPYNGFRLLLKVGDGPVFEDALAPRTASIQACLAIFAAGVALNGLGYMASRTRRRYGHAVLGSVGAFLSVGFYIGPLLGLVAYILLRGARDAFSDRRSLFSPGTGPRLYEDEDDHEDDDEDEAEEDDTDKSATAHNRAAEAQAPDSPGEKGEAPKEGSR